MSISFIKKAESVTIASAKSGSVILTVNDKSALLDRRHPIAVSSSLTSTKDAEISLQGGYFVMDDTSNKLVEYRDNSYTGFTQTDAFIERFARDDLNKRGFDDFELTEFGLGGAFNLTAGFTWSAFSKNLKTQVSVMRQICANGMVARSPMLEREVPIINLFDHHLNIAAKQLIDISRPHISNRLSKMAREHALVREVDLVSSHVQKRISESPLDQRLININEALMEVGDISAYYTKRAQTTGVVQTLPSTISRFDLFNITTELNTHTDALVESTSSSLDRLASGLLFPKHVTGIISERNVAHSTFGNPELAFFG